MRWVVKWGGGSIALAVVVLAVLNVTGVLSLNAGDVVRTDTVVQAVRDVSRYQAAIGGFEVVVQVEDGKWNVLPTFIKGRRALFIAVGSVPAYVDLGTLGDDAMSVSAKDRTVTIRLPQGELDEPNLDQANSRLVDFQLGVIDRFGQLSEKVDTSQLAVLAQDRMTTAAQSAGLVQRAEENTRNMLTGLIGALGYQTVFV